MFGADIPVNMAVPGGVVNSRQLSSSPYHVTTRANPMGRSMGPQLISKTGII